MQSKTKLLVHLDLFTTLLFFPISEVLSCRYLQTFGLKKDKRYPDGIYPIYPKGLAKQPIKAYCDMSRDGGGWTLLMTSRTNTWTSNNTLLRNQDSPSLSHDYSFLKYADGIKNELNIGGNTAEYRLEAENRGLHFNYYAPYRLPTTF